MLFDVGLSSVFFGSVSSGKENTNKQMELHQNRKLFIQESISCLCKFAPSEHFIQMESYHWSFMTDFFHLT